MITLIHFPEGHGPQCLRCGCNKVVSVQYDYNSPEHYDGISEYWCPDCNIRVGRWSGLELKKNQLETRFGEGLPYIPDDCPKCDKQKNPKFPTCFDCRNQ